MRTLRRLSLVAAAAALAACAATDTDPADSAGADSMAAADPNAATAGGGVPAGYVGVVDPGSGDDVAQANYTMADGRWTVRTGPAHVVVAPGDSASGNYTATASFEQMERPEHPEAFGLVIGATGMDGGAQRYTYFIVRHTGEAMVRVREGDSTRTVMDWTANPNVPQADSGGRASYSLAANVGADSVRFTVNGQPVTSVARSAVPTAGLAGVRINHNLHLTVTPLRIERN